jgi:single-stranded-DNA-specific exonuclease
MRRRVWEIRQYNSALAKALSDELGLPLVIAKLLVQRKVMTGEQGRRFLAPTLEELDDPDTMKGMPKAVERIVAALRLDEKICIWGDYDVDGVTSVALLLLFLRSAGLEADYHIPSRLQDGYGLNADALDEIASKGTNLLITVDCGITEVELVRHAKKSGMDVIIIDHHQVPQELPPAVAILNPHQEGCRFPTKELAAVGVTFNLVMALRRTLRSHGMFNGNQEPNLKECLDLVSLGTVADIVPLLDENRIITYFGLTELTAGRRPGIAALKEVSGIMKDKVTAGQVAFRLAPRINAVGRLGEASLAVDLLTTNSYSKALSLARKLDETNSQRKGIEQEIMDDALRQAEPQVEKSASALVLASDRWHLGVVGIVASRLVERFERPVVMIVVEGKEGRGSARSTEHIDLYSAISDCDDYLLQFGGHRAAAGLTIDQEKIDEFRNAFTAAIDKQVAESGAKKIIYVDEHLQPAELSIDLVESINVLAPHGMGNPEPLFLAKNLFVKSARLVGHDPYYHLKATLSDNHQAAGGNGPNWDTIGFGMGDKINEFKGQVDIIYSPTINLWSGQPSIQLKLKAARRVEV